MRNSIDLRKEMDEMIEDQGHPVLLQRTNRKIRCRCWNEMAQEADFNCPICLGKGWLLRIERHKIRSDAAIQIVTRPNLQVLSPVGQTYVDALAFYFKHDTHPQVGDFIYEVGWHPKMRNKPTHIIRCYEINDVYPLRGDNGRLEYYLVSTKAEIIKNPNAHFVVRSIGPIKNYELVQRR